MSLIVSRVLVGSDSVKFLSDSGRGLELLRSDHVYELARGGDGWRVDGDPLCLVLRALHLEQLKHCSFVRVVD